MLTKKMEETDGRGIWATREHSNDEAVFSKAAGFRRSGRRDERRVADGSDKIPEDPGSTPQNYSRRWKTTAMQFDGGEWSICWC
jgi:hypothetical protein